MFDRQQLMTKYRGMIASGEPIVGGGAGTGLSAMRGSGRDRPDRDLQFRSLSDGRARQPCGPHAYGDANSVVMDMAGEVLPVVRHTPVLAGVCASDPFG